MYTKEGIKMANDILGFIRRGEANRDFEMYREMRSSYNRNDDEFSKNVRIIWMQLVSIGLLEYKNGELMLTKDGVIAADLNGGIVEYIQSYKKELDDSSVLRKTTIWNNKVQIAVGVTSLLSFIAGVLLSGPIKNLWNHILDKL